MITNIYPQLDGGRYPIKTEVDREFYVYCEVSKSSSKSSPLLKYRQLSPTTSQWKTKKMKKITATKYEGVIKFNKLGIYEYKVDNSFTQQIFVEPIEARFSAWYEMFHRSQGKVPGKSATFADMEERLSDIKNMGFDVIYLPPVHPIGITKRKGPNNSVIAGPNDPGSPWAIGNQAGGHKAINPELGTIDEFDSFVKKAEEMGFKIALDIAFNCSPDHPYVREHPEWFYKRADGSIAYAENPPKKYEDIYPLNFYPENREELWNEIKSIFLYWISHNIKIFRIDNPHTKPSEFWEWLIRELKKEYPDVILLSEAFTYYEKLEELAKIGFTQSYTYFTWRNNKNEVLEYFTKLTSPPLKYFLRGNLFTNTPDICPPIIQKGGRAAFKMRIALASTLSSSYGMYNGYELCEANAFEGTEIYRNSEKYEYKVWDWNRAGNIKDYISILNNIRKTNPALRYYDNLKFCNSTSDNVIAYIKVSQDRKNRILVVINLNVYGTEDSRVTLPLEDIGIVSGSDYQIVELITNHRYWLRNDDIYVRLNPQYEPCYIFRIEQAKKKIEPLPEDNQSMIQSTKDIETFFRLREIVTTRNDVYTRRELAEFYKNNIVPKVYIGQTYDEVYTESINKISQSRGYSSIINAYITAPGH
ncbi:MAG: maltotransferase domain-containing protein [Candidatus Hydrogenedentota bacterium]